MIIYFFKPKTKFMKPNQFYSILLFFVGTITFSQVGVGTSDPDPSAVLHLETSDKGFLPPKILLLSNFDGTTIPNPANGLIVYNINTSFGVQGLYINVGTPGSPNWRALQTQAIAGPVIEYNDIITSAQGFNIRSLPNNGSWIEFLTLRKDIIASEGARINISLNGMVEVWNTSGARSFQNDYLVIITPDSPLARTLDGNNYRRNGVVISRTTNDGSSVQIYGSQALSYNFSKIAPKSSTYFIQVYIKRSNTATVPTNAWEIINCSLNLLVTK